LTRQKASAYYGEMRRLLVGFLAVALCVFCTLFSGCHGPEYLGHSVQLIGNVNNWSRALDVPMLEWDGEKYVGTFVLPGEVLVVRLRNVMHGEVYGTAQSQTIGGVPGVLPVKPNPAEGHDLRIAIPFPALYTLTFFPEKRTFRIDFAERAELGQVRSVAKIISMLRGSDQLPIQQQKARAAELLWWLKNADVPWPIASSYEGHESFSFWYFGETDTYPVSLNSSWTDWKVQADPMGSVLGGTVWHLGKKRIRDRVEYMFDVYGNRKADPLNLEVAWDNVTPAQNPENMLGGNRGDFHSLAIWPGKEKDTWRLRRFPMSSDIPGFVAPEVFVYLPRDIPWKAVATPADPTPASTEKYPVLFVFDGKDALTSGNIPKLLDAQQSNGKIPVIGVFVSSPSDPQDRLSFFANEIDENFPKVNPQGALLAAWFSTSLIPNIEKTFPTLPKYGLWGIDLAAIWATRQIWEDTRGRLVTLLSQSGRFGWGSVSGGRAPTIELMKSRLPPRLHRIALDYSLTDHEQSRSRISEVKAALGTLLVQVVDDSRAQPHVSYWDSLRDRAVGLPGVRPGSLPYVLDALASE